MFLRRRKTYFHQFHHRKIRSEQKSFRRRKRTHRSPLDEMGRLKEDPTVPLPYPSSLNLFITSSPCWNQNPKEENLITPIEFTLDPRDPHSSISPPRESQNQNQTPQIALICDDYFRSWRWRRVGFIPGGERRMLWDEKKLAKGRRAEGRRLREEYKGKQFRTKNTPLKIYIYIYNYDLMIYHWLLTIRSASDSC